MELRTLRYFTTIADTGTVSAAAQSLHVTQPGLSRQVRQLEKELGVELFDRTHGRLTLSGAGRALLPHIRAVLAQAESVTVTAGVLARGSLESVTISAPLTTLTEVIAPFIAGLQSADPTPSVFTSDGLGVPEALRRGADLVITNGLPGEEMESVPVAQLPVWAYAPPDHPLAGLDTVDVVDLLRHPIIGVPAESTGRQAFDAALLRAGLALRYSVEASSGPVAQALAAAGRGVAVVTDDPRFGLRGLRIVAGADPVCIRLFASWRADHPGRLQLAQIAHRLQDFTAEQYGEGTRPAGVRTTNT